MKTTAIISDIHGNFDALTAALLDMKKYSPERIVCLGDIIGYGAEPCACLDALLEMDNIDFILGNHEDIWLGGISSDMCSGIGKISAEWNKHNIPAHYESRVRGFVPKLTRGDITYCHTASMEKAHNYPYLNSLEQVTEGFADSGDRIVFYGHTHRARITEITDTGEVFDKFVKKTTKIELNKSSRYFINIGSVGQQRDTITDCSYAILWESGEEKTVQINRIEYDSYSAYAKTRSIVQSEEIAAYLIREDERRKRYENAYNGC